MMWLWVCGGQMESVIAKPIGIALRSSFFRKGTNDAMMDNTLSAKADEGGKENHWATNESITKWF